MLSEFSNSGFYYSPHITICVCIIIFLNFSFFKILELYEIILCSQLLATNHIHIQRFLLFFELDYGSDSFPLLCKYFVQFLFEIIFLTFRRSNQSKVLQSCSSRASSLVTFIIFMFSKILPYTFLRFTGSFSCPHFYIFLYHPCFFHRRNIRLAVTLY